MFAAYVSGRDHAFVDRVLYLPKDWTRDPARTRAAHVPKGSSSPPVAPNMTERAMAAGVLFSWVAADTVYGAGEEVARGLDPRPGGACPRAKAQRDRA